MKAIYVVKYKPVSHEHEAFLNKALKRKEFRKAYEDLEEEYRLTREMLAARSRFGLTQEAVAELMGRRQKVQCHVWKRRVNMHHR